MSFEGLIGNQKVKKILQDIIDNKKYSHSYLFTGIEGIGKFQFAKEFAKNILCENEDACNICKSCLEFNSENHPDFYKIDVIDGSTIKIDQIKKMQEKIIEKPIISKKKVYIINNADLMVIPAQNCLLKTLEEPPQYVTIILVTANEGKILSTIKSRCVLVNFNPINKDELSEYIKDKGLDNSKELMDIYEGSIKRVYDIQEKKDIYLEINKIFNNIEKIKILDILGKCECLYKQKDMILDILNYINIIFFNKVKNNNYQYLKYISYVEEAKQNLYRNVNYDMVIDKLILNIWKG